MTAQSSENSFNQLVQEQSLYLRQHAQDPVHWVAWDPHAISQRAQAEHKIILLSSGYSSCHWCHVLQRESFQDPQVALFLNQYFICVKLDKEEHPDVDFFYQQVLQNYAKRGGWPLTVFLSPIFIPLFAGTYFPAQSQGNVPSFLNVCQLVLKEYQNNADKMLEQGRLILGGLKSSTPKQPDESDESTERSTSHFPSAQSILKALMPYADKDFGGWGPAPKFPQFAFLETFLDHLLQGVLSADQSQHLIHTCLSMMSSGFADQIKGGCHRYSTDQRWLIPHFEKMLYDQAGMLRLLTKAYLATQHPLLMEHLERLLVYLSSEMLSSETPTYYFSSQDAESPEGEGRYYAFSAEQVQELFQANFTQAQSEELMRYFGMTAQGNFAPGLNIATQQIALLPQLSNLNSKIIQEALALLRLDRSERIPGSTDRKGIANWNAQLLSAFSMAAQYLQDQGLRMKIKQDFLTQLEGFEQRFVQTSGPALGDLKIQHTTTRPHLSTLYFEDYVFYLEACWRAYQLTAKKHFWERCERLVQELRLRFWRQGEWKASQSLSSHPAQGGPSELETLWDQQPVSTADQSYKSPLATFYYLLHLFQLIPNDQKRNIIPYGQYRDEIYQQLAHQSLKNPLAHGEALRSLIYPAHSWKCLHLPSEWIHRQELQELLPYFGSRFCFYFTDDSQEWSICGMERCELNGLGIEHFIQSVTSAKTNEGE